MMSLRVFYVFCLMGSNVMNPLEYVFVICLLPTLVEVILL